MNIDFHLGITSFYASLHKLDECELNGLPRLPYSVNMIGRFEQLKSLDHPNICRYLDARRDKHERIVIATEYYSSTLESDPIDIDKLGRSKTIEVLYRFASAIEYLHESAATEIVVRNICPRNIFWTNEGEMEGKKEGNLIKIVNYGLYFMTNGGLEVDFLIGSLPYLPPESVLDLYLLHHRPDLSSDRHNIRRLSCPRSDVWSIGILILQSLLHGHLPAILTNDLQATAQFLLEFLFSSNKQSDLIESLNLSVDHNETIVDNQDLLNLARKCLRIDVVDRISMGNLKKELFALRSIDLNNNNNININNNNNNNKIDKNECSFTNSVDRKFDWLMNLETEKENERLIDDCRLVFGARERFFFWGLTGGDLWRALAIAEAEAGERQSKLPPVLTVPKLIRGVDGEELWSQESSRAVRRLFCERVMPLRAVRLARRLKAVSVEIACSLMRPIVALPVRFRPFELDSIEFVDSLRDGDEADIDGCDMINSDGTTVTAAAGDALMMRSQPVWVKEKDFEYQLRRVVLFKRLLRGYPLTERMLLKEASYDIPPLLRAEIWPLLLGIDLETALIRYTKVQGVLLEDKAASQITVDLPRCHSYDEFIVSSSGQGKLCRILHAWLIHHPYLEYTQGMDSLCAVFVRLLFNQEAIAFACLEAFVNKFMRGLFCVSHGQALNEYCMVLQQLLAFHKPHLSQAINIFSITGFTASWIYTGFAHSLSLDKTLRLWDTVILGEPSFLMMIFIALLGQLDQESEFSSQATEQVFSVLSNLQEFDLDSCRIEAINLARKTPPSVTYRSLAFDSVVNTKLVDPQNICISPKISFDDLLILLGETNSSCQESSFSPFSFCSDILSPPVLLDLRMRENFQKGSLPGSRHLPIVSASPHTTFTELEALNARSIISEYENSYKIIISTVDDHLCEMVAKILVNTYHFEYVCILKGGINAVHCQRPDLLIVNP